MRLLFQNFFFLLKIISVYFKPSCHAKVWFYFYDKVIEKGVDLYLIILVVC